MQKILADGYICVCIATAVDFSIQVQTNQWKIVWLRVSINCNLLLEVVLYFARVAKNQIFFVKFRFIHRYFFCQSNQLFSCFMYSVKKRNRAGAT